MPRQSQETVDLVTQPDEERALDKNGYGHGAGPAPAAPRRRVRLPGFLLPVAAAVVCGASAFIICDNFVTPWYSSATTLYFPAAGNQGASGFISSLLGGAGTDSSGSVPILGGIYNVPLVGSGPGTAIMALASGRCQGQVASSLHLDQKWHMTPDKVAARLTKNVTYGIDKNGLLSIQANDTDPKMAQRLVNAYVLAMQDVSKQLSLAQSHSIRVALQAKLLTRQHTLHQEQDSLVNLETHIAANLPLGPGVATVYSDLDSQRRTTQIDLKTTQAEIAQRDKTAQAAQGVSLPEQMPYAQQSRLRLRDLQAKLATAKATLGPDNSQLQDLQIQTQQAQDQYTAELGRELTVVKKGIAPDMATLYVERASLQAKLDGIQKALSPLHSALLALPDAQMQQQRLTSDIARDEKLVDELAMSAQQAEIAEQRDVPTFQTVDAASVPDKPSLPRIGFTTALAAVAGFLLALAWQVAGVLLRQPVTQSTMRRWTDAYGLTENDERYRLPGDEAPAALSDPGSQLARAPQSKADPARLDPPAQESLSTSQNPEPAETRRP